MPKNIIASVNEILFNQKTPNLSVHVESQLYDLFKEDIVLLEKMLEINLSSWKK